MPCAKAMARWPSQGLSSDQGNIKGIANAFGYSDEELASIPAEANMGLSCGNPVAMASIKEGKLSLTWALVAGWMCFWPPKVWGRVGRPSAST